MLEGKSDNVTTKEVSIGICVAILTMEILDQCYLRVK
jgi:hypothetical protein